MTLSSRNYGVARIDAPVTESSDQATFPTVLEFENAGTVTAAVVLGFLKGIRGRSVLELSPQASFSSRP
jgi:hypothetical protein